MLQMYRSIDELSTIDIETDIMTEPITAVPKTWRTLQIMVSNTPKLSGMLYYN